MIFHAAAFATSTPRERIAMCRSLAAEAEGLAAKSNGETREGYAQLAKAWFTLAAEIAKLDGGANEAR